MCCSPSAHRLSRARESLPSVTCCDKELIYLSQPAGYLPRASVLARLSKFNWSVHAFLKRPRVQERELSAHSSTRQVFPWTLGSGDFLAGMGATLYVFPCLLYRMSMTWYFSPLFLFLYERALLFWAYSFSRATGSHLLMLLRAFRASQSLATLASSPCPRRCQRVPASLQYVSGCGFARLTK